MFDRWLYTPSPRCRSSSSCLSESLEITLWIAFSTCRPLNLRFYVFPRLSRTLNLLSAVLIAWLLTNRLILLNAVGRDLESFEITLRIPFDVSTRQPRIQRYHNISSIDTTCCQHCSSSCCLRMDFNYTMGWVDILKASKARVDCVFDVSTLELCDVLRHSSNVQASTRPVVSAVHPIIDHW